MDIQLEAKFYYFILLPAIYSLHFLTFLFTYTAFNTVQISAFVCCHENLICPWPSESVRLVKVTSTILITQLFLKPIIFQICLTGHSMSAFSSTLASLSKTCFSHIWPPTQVWRVFACIVTWNRQHPWQVLWCIYWHLKKMFLSFYLKAIGCDQLQMIYVVQVCAVMCFYIKLMVWMKAMWQWWYSIKR